MSVASLKSLCAVLALSAVVRLGWDANEESSVVGYRLYHGPASRAYTASNTTAGTETSVTVTGRTYFAVTAFAADGLESDYSDEVVYSGVTVRVVLEESCDPTGPWEAVWTAPNAQAISGRFYRARMEIAQ